MYLMAWIVCRLQEAYREQKEEVYSCGGGNHESYGSTRIFSLIDDSFFETAKGNEMRESS